MCSAHYAFNVLTFRYPYYKLCLSFSQHTNAGLAHIALKMQVNHISITTRAKIDRYNQRNHDLHHSCC